MLRRRDFLTGAAALAVYGALDQADALTLSQRRVILGGAGIPAFVPNPSNPPDYAFNWTTNQAWVKATRSLTTPAAVGVTTSRASVKQVVDSNGNWSQVAANTTAVGNGTGRSTEEARTNGIRNNSMVGAVVGTPGTAPTNWTVTQPGSGVSAAIVNTGMQNGINFIDVQVSGTTTAPIPTSNALINFETNTQVAALTGQTWSQSAFIQIVGGTFAGTLSMDNCERSNTGNLVQSNTVVISPTTTLSRLSVSTTLSGGASTAFIGPLLRYGVGGTGTVVNFTLRIGWPQLENNSLINSSVASATVQAGGSGGTTGTAVYSVGGGTGTAATLNVTVSGGAITAINSVANAGSYTTFPPGPAALTYVSGTGSGVTGATVNLTPTNNAAAGFATSPIITSGSAATRAADVTSMPVTVGSAYTMFEQATPEVPISDTSPQVFLQVDDGSTNNRALLRRSQVSGLGNLLNIVAGTSLANMTGGTAPQGSVLDIAGSFAAGTQQLSVNGVLATAGTGASVPTIAVTTLRFGSDSNSLTQLNGLATIDAIWLTQAIPNAQLQALQ